jgi:hypothetical protein
MTHSRRKYSESESALLVREVLGMCPLCTKELHFMKGSKYSKAYEIAHIYPLNPTAAQAAALKNIPPPADINGLDNVIALCVACHTEYDKDFKIDEFHNLQTIKQNILAQTSQYKSFGSYPLAKEIKIIIEKIVSTDEFDEVTEPGYNPVTLKSKIGNGISPVKRRSITNNVRSYYSIIREDLKQLEKQEQYKVKLLLSQIRSFYCAMLEKTPDSKDAIFEGIVSWLEQKSKSSTEACMVLAAFFVQNCEIFDADA